MDLSNSYTSARLLKYVKRTFSSHCSAAVFRNLLSVSKPQDQGLDKLPQSNVAAINQLVEARLSQWMDTVPLKSARARTPAHTHILNHVESVTIDIAAPRTLPLPKWLVSQYKSQSQKPSLKWSIGISQT